ncbi:MAG: 2-C-methyl-D-erythritol 4-phosphate cytidylyltransferase [Lentisphaeria bacterium]|nr:2-C-methyl-D-erythritol 4-phosphate cytidylyltransferase [Lentisphaeria bacterium]MBR7145520.1 2-C-methyl-D-erythritol 4-phosphate cytidylyltransferase [Lentisphaeria bacterium]
MLFEKLGMVIAAGGSGSRFSKTVNKLLVDYQGKPLMIHALSTFLPVLAPGNMVVAAPAAELENMRNIAGKYLPGNSIKWVTGGATRLASVANGVAALPGDLEQVAIHDAARPLATVELLQELCSAAKEFGGAVPGAMPVDTVKRLDENGLIAENLIRARLANVATPQVFDRRAYCRALAELDKSLLDGSRESLLITDDAALFAQAGGKVKVVFHSLPNPKITLPTDI